MNMDSRDAREIAGILRDLERRLHSVESELGLEPEPPAEPQPDSDGWIPWHGGVNYPVDGETRVDVRLRSYDEKMDRLASVFRWNHAGSATDIIAYRPAKQVAEWPQNGNTIWIINIRGGVTSYSWNNSDIKNDAKGFLGIYPTREQAEEAAAKIKRVMEHLRNGGAITLGAPSLICDEEVIRL